MTVPVVRLSLTHPMTGPQVVEVLGCATVTSERKSGPAASMSTKAFAIGIALAGVLGFAVRFGTFLWEGRTAQLSGDAVFYHDSANLMAEGKGYINPFYFRFGHCFSVDLGGVPDPNYSFIGSAKEDCPKVDVVQSDGTVIAQTKSIAPGTEMATAAHPPLWPFILSVSSRLGFDSINEHRMVGLLFGSLGVVLIGLAGRELFGERVGVVAAFIAAVYGFLWMNDWSLMSESLVTAFVPLMTIVAVRWWRNPSWRLAVLLGVLSGVGGLLRTELLAYGPLLVLAAFVVRRVQWKSLLRDLGVVITICLVLLAPWLIRNMTSFAKPIYLSPTGTLLAQTNCDAAYYGMKTGYWERFCAEPEPANSDGSQLDESERDTIKRGWAVDYISTHKSRLLVVAPLRTLRMFNLYDPIGTARFDIHVENREFRQSMVALGEYFVVALLAIVGSIFAWRRKLTLFPVLLWPALVAVVAAASLGNNRYRLCAEPSLIWLASLALVLLAGRLRRIQRETDSNTTVSTAINPS
jgi:Dolichyl-phosphate-mannose-protein mannosyltransferase